MNRTWLLVILSILAVEPLAFAKTHKFNYSVSCEVLWPAVKDTVRNSGKYGIIAIDNAEMTASYNIGGALGGKRINSAVLNRIGENACEMQVQTAFSGLAHNDAGDFKKRVDESLAKESQTGKKAGKDTGSQQATPGNQQNPLLPEPAKVQVSSSPAGADIEIDGNFVGNTPSTLSLPPGDHTVTVKKAGYRPWERKLRVGAGDETTLMAELEKPQ